MWQRLSRVFRSFFGFFISVAEDPELILQQNIRDMNDQVPRMNESIAMVKANVTLLEREQAKYQTDMASLTAKVKAAIQAIAMTSPAPTPPNWSRPRAPWREIKASSALPAPPSTRPWQ